MGQSLDKQVGGRIRNLALEELRISEACPDYEPASLDDLKRAALLEVVRNQHDETSRSDPD